jgi:hypothetical protein
MVAPIWRRPLLAGASSGRMTGRAGRGDRPQGSRRTRESSPDLADDRDPGAPASPVTSVAADGKAHEGRSREAGAVAAGRELRRGRRPTRVSSRKGGSTPRKRRLFGRRNVLEPRRNSRPSRPQRRRQGGPETARGQRPGNGCGWSKGQALKGEPHGRLRSSDRERQQGASRREGRNPEAGRCRVRQARVSRTCSRASP